MNTWEERMSAQAKGRELVREVERDLAWKAEADNPSEELLAAEDEYMSRLLADGDLPARDPNIGCACIGSPIGSAHAAARCACRLYEAARERQARP